MTREDFNASLTWLRASGLRSLMMAPAIFAACVISGCSTLPEAGPPAKAVVNGAKAPPGLNYYLVAVSPQILSIINSRRGRELERVFADGHPIPSQPIGVGDMIAVTIWDRAGLFGVAKTSNTPGVGAVAETQSDTVAATLPTQEVTQSGEINIPFAGRIPAAGLTPSQVEREIIDRIKGNTIAPQVLVTIIENKSAVATVTGDVNHPGRVPLSVNGTRLLDGVALAGGATAQTSDIAVQLTRDGITRRVRLEEVVKEPSENIYLKTGDLVYLVKEPQTAVILGATSKNEQVSFIKATMSLAEMVGNGGGLSDLRADPYGVFIFRYEPAALVRSLGPETVEPDANGLVPVVYQVNLKTPTGYFVAQAFPIHDRDLIYVADTETVQLSKLANLLHDFTSLFQSSGYSQSTVVNGY